MVQGPPETTGARLFGSLCLLTDDGGLHRRHGLLAEALLEVLGLRRRCGRSRECSFEVSDVTSQFTFPVRCSQVVSLRALRPGGRLPAVPTGPNRVNGGMKDSMSLSGSQ